MLFNSIGFIVFLVVVPLVEGQLVIAQQQQAHVLARQQTVGQAPGELAGQAVGLGGAQGHYGVSPDLTTDAPDLQRRTGGLTLDDAADPIKLVGKVVRLARRRDLALVRGVDAAAMDVLKEKGYGDFLLHRTGHGMGITGHEGPFLAEGYDRELAALCEEVFGDRPWRYREPQPGQDWLRPHLANYDWDQRPKFRWRPAPIPDRPKVLIQTTMGDIEVELDAKAALGDLTELVSDDEGEVRIAAILALGFLEGWTASLTVSRAASFASRMCSVKGAIPESPAFYEPYLNWISGGQ